MITSAVILAAGLGSRLKERTKLQPKGFLELENKSLIERSINKLISCGIENIYIGTGYLSEVYDNSTKIDFGAGRYPLGVYAMRRSYCVTLDNNEVKCWGRNLAAYLGNPAKTDNIGDEAGEMGDNLIAIDFE